VKKQLKIIFTSNQAGCLNYYDAVIHASSIAKHSVDENQHCAFLNCC